MVVCSTEPERSWEFAPSVAVIALLISQLCDRSTLLLWN
jgi:hypothetical protein